MKHFFQDCKLRESTLTLELKSKSEYQQLCFKLVNFCFKLSKAKKQTQNVAVSLSIHLLVTENTRVELVTFVIACFNDNSSLKVVITAAHLFSD